MTKGDDELRITGINKIPTWAMAKIPITITFIIEDVKGERYQMDVDMDNGFDAEGMGKAAVIGFQLCENTPCAVHVESVVKRDTGFSKNN